ncbi:hypothetical protein AYO41_01265 [Verrucomicrobia bacterium SCGC AG-212-E04]|nr:hypothetical protein AYO41_01265 [Verrucomicrobia bacterium SCGC AG-212-E04]
MRYLATLAAGLLVALSAPRVDAVIVQDFEAGLAPGTPFGDVQRLGTYGVPPFGGNFQLLLTTFNATDGPGLSGTNAIAVNGAGGLTSQLGLPAGTITFAGAIPVGTGSAYQLTLGALVVGQQVGFSYDFLTSEGGHPDFAFAALQNTTTGVVTYIAFANANQGGLVVSPSPNFNLETGYLTLAGINVNVAGNYVLSIGVADANNTSIASGLLIDNITVSVIPEPSTLALALVGIVGVTGFIRRRRLA